MFSAAILPLMRQSINISYSVTYYIYSNKGCSLKSLRLESTKSSRFHETPTNNDFQEGPYFIIFPVESGNFL